jgi:hypothetical protein
MLASIMMLETYEEGGSIFGFVATISFLIAFVLSKID